MSGWTAQGTVYHVAPPPLGNDANPGTTFDKPFATLQKAATTTDATEVIIRGGIYRETVVPSKDGILFKAYNGEAVTVSGADVIRGWIPYTGNAAGGAGGNGGGKIHVSSDMAWSLDNAVANAAGNGLDNQVFVDGLMLDLARTPNNPARELLTAPRHTVDGAVLTANVPSAGKEICTVTDDELSVLGQVQPNFYVGGLFHQIGSGDDGGSYGMGTTNWITGSSGNQITMQMTDPGRDYKYRPASGTLYYIDGVAKLLDSPGEWFRLQDGRLLVWMPDGDTPARHVVEAKRRLYGFQLAGRSRITLEGIRLFACTIYTDSRCTENVFRRIDVVYPSHFGFVRSVYENGVATLDWNDRTSPGAGVYLTGSRSIFEKGSVAYAAGSAVAVGGKNNQVLDNLIHDVAYMGVDGAGVTTGHREMDLASAGSCAGTEIGRNTIYNGSRALVQMRGLYAGNVHHNHLWNGMLNTFDYGAIYALNHDREPSVRLRGPGGGFSRISRNRIHSTPPWGGKASVGVYLDNDSYDYVVDHNVIWGSTAAIMMTATAFNPLGNEAEAYVMVDPDKNAAGLNFEGPVTLAAWIQPWPTHSSLPRNILRHGPQAGNEVFLRITNGFYEVGSSRTENGAKTVNIARFAQPVTDENQWVHLAGVYDGTRWILYRNGVAVASQEAAFGAVKTVSPGTANTASVRDRDWKIGGMIDWGEDSFEGYMDEVRMYKGALGADQVRMLAGNQVPATAPGMLQIHLGFDNHAAGNRTIPASTAGTASGYASFRNWVVEPVARAGVAVNKALRCPPTKAWRGMHVYNNTCDGPIGYGSELTPRVNTDDPRSRFLNNLCLDRSTHIWFDPGDRRSAGITQRQRRTHPTLLVDRNYCTYGGANDPDWISLSNIGFLAASDYRLKPGSPLRGKGIPVPPVPVPDTQQAISGNSYPLRSMEITEPGSQMPDIGAYEGGEWIAGAQEIAAGTLPNGWAFRDFGANPAVSPMGYTACVNNNYYVTGGGAGIERDAFHFASGPMAGDGEITATLLHVEQANQGARASAGLMLRADATENAPFVGLALERTGVKLLSRGGLPSAATGRVAVPANNSSLGSGITHGILVEAACEGGEVTKVVFRANGVYVATATAPPYFARWTPPRVGNYTLTAELTNSANVTTAATAAVVTVSDQVLQASCVMTSPVNASTVFTGETISLSAYGDVAPGNVQTANGQAVPRAIQKFVYYVSENGGGWAYYRTGSGTGFAASYVPAVPGTYRFKARLYENGAPEVSWWSPEVAVQVLDTQPVLRPPVHLKLSRVGGTVTGSYSLDGEMWTPVGTESAAAFPSSIHAGLAVTTANDQTLHTAVFGGLKVDGQAYPRSVALESLQTYTVSYLANGATSGTAPAAQTKTQGVALTLSGNTGNLVKAGHTFSGWNTAADGTGANYAVGSNYTADAGMVLYAKWTVIPTYTVSYLANGATSGTAPAAQTKTQGGPLTLSGNTGNLVKAGHTFSGWNTAADGTGANYAVGSNYTADAGMVLYAKWTVIPTYTVSYQANGATSGTAPAAQTKTQGVALTLSGNTGNLVKAGHTFSGWNTAADGTGANYAVGSNYTADAGMVLHAKWGVIPTYTVSYQANGATSGTVPAAQTKTQGVALTLSGNTGNLVKAGHTFSGWNTAADGTGANYAAGANYTADAGMVLYANWSLIPTYTVSYQANGATGGTAPAAQTKTQGVALTLLGNTGNLVKAGHTFSGWNTAADGTGANYAVGSNYTADAGMVLYAKWGVDVRKAPSFKKGPDQIVALGSPEQTVPNWATEIRSGAPELESPRRIFVLGVDRPELFETQPTVSETGTLVYKPSSLQTGQAQVTVALHESVDAGETVFAQSFSIRVFSPNEQFGVYNGLVREPGDGRAAHASSGMVRVAVGRTGAFSATLWLGGARYRAAGALDGKGVARFGKTRVAALPLMRRGKTPLKWSFSLDSADPDILTGLVTEAGVEFVRMHAERAPFTAKPVAALSPVHAPRMMNVREDVLGQYTVVFEAKPVEGMPGMGLPQGAGIGYLVLSGSGVVRMAGRLADGTPVSAGNSISKGYAWPFYCYLYRGRGSVGGDVRFRNLDTTDVDGAALRWFRPGILAAKAYPKGWESGLVLDLVGSRYFRPARVAVPQPQAGRASSGETGANALFTLKNGSSSSVPFSQPLWILPSQKVALIGPNPAGFRIAIQPGTGLWSGRFLHPDTGRPTPFWGVLLQKQRIGHGFCLVPSGSGAVHLELLE